MSKIYVVFDGYYSNKTALCAFDNEKSAALYCAAKRGFGYEDELSIKEIELNPCTFANEETVYVYRCYRKEFESDKKKNEIAVGDKPHYRYFIDPHCILKTLDSARTMKCTNKEFYIIVEKDDLEKVKKIAQDKISEIKAQTEGIC